MSHSMLGRKTDVSTLAATVGHDARVRGSARIGLGALSFVSTSKIIGQVLGGSETNESTVAAYWIKLVHFVFDLGVSV